VTRTDDFDAFYRETRQRVAATLYALIGDLTEAQDVTQEAYARAWQRWRRVREYDDPEAWVRTVARRIVFSGWRKTRNRVAAYRRHGPAPPTAAPSEDTVALVTALRALLSGGAPGTHHIEGGGPVRLMPVEILVSIGAWHP